MRIIYLANDQGFLDAETGTVYVVRENDDDSDIRELRVCATDGEEYAIDGAEVSWDEMEKDEAKTVRVLAQKLRRLYNLAPLSV